MVGSNHESLTPFYWMQGAREPWYNPKSFNTEYGHHGKKNAKGITISQWQKKLDDVEGLLANRHSPEEGRDQTRV